VLEQVLNIKEIGFPQFLPLRDSWSIGWTVLLKIKEIFMIFVLQIFRTLTTNFKAWTHVFRPLMNRLKLFKTSFLSCSMGKKIEAKFSYSFYACIALFWTILFLSLPKVYL